MQSTIALVVGTRPNFVKAAPVLRALETLHDVHPVLLHSGQHFDHTLSKAILNDVGIRKPDMLCNAQDDNGWNPNLFATQCKQFFQEHSPVMVLVFGDVDTTRIAAEVAHTCGIRIAHIEAGLRSFDSRMIEDANRIKTDQLSEFLFTTEESAMRNIEKENLDGKAFLVGNTMIDTLIFLKNRIENAAANIQYDKPTIVVTLHRRENIQNKETMEFLLQQLEECASEYAMHWPLHPHTKKMIAEFNLSDRLSSFDMCEPEGYIEFLAHISKADAVVTDSGGIQEETTYLGIPCFTLRKSTERPVTVEVGTNVLLPLSALRASSLLSHIQKKQDHTPAVPALWDGCAAERIVSTLSMSLG